jgi:hypothetical protein
MMIVVHLDHQRPAALPGIDADRRWIADPGIERSFKVHDKDRAYVMTDIIFVDGDK